MSLDTNPSPAGEGAGVHASAWRLLALLTGLNVLNFLDRQLLAALAPLVMENLGLTHRQIGLLLGFAFGAFFSVAGLFMGTVADRFSRPRLIAAGLGLWSLTTAASGAAQGLGHLALARLLVGVGEATLIPTALSLLADAFPPARLGLAAAVFTTGISLGQALGNAGAGVLAPIVGWRGCFALLGAVGFLLVRPVLAIDDPRPPGHRGERPPARLGEIAGGMGRTLVSVPAMGLTILGVTGMAFAVGGALHTVNWLVHDRGFNPPQAALLSALMVVTGGPLGNLAVGALADRWARSTPGGRLLTLAVLGLLAAATSAAFYASRPSSLLFYAAWFLSSATVTGWLGTALAAYESLAPPRFRATAVALALLCLNLLGMGPGALVTGWLGDMTSLTEGLLVSAGAAALAAVPFALAAARYETDLRTARSLA